MDFRSPILREHYQHLSAHAHIETILSETQTLVGNVNNIFSTPHNTLKIAK